MKAPIVWPERRTDRSCEPVESNIRQHAITADGAFRHTVVIRPCAEFFYDPCGETCRGICEAEGQCLRFGSLNLLVPAFFPEPVRKSLTVSRFPFRIPTGDLFPRPDKYMTTIPDT